MTIDRRTLSIALALAIAVAGLYARTLSFEFVNFDDGDYVHDNPWVSHGLSWDGVRWAFTRWHSGNWHPLTWLSHMLDCQLFGLDAGWHHLANLLLHAANSVLLFAALRTLTGVTWRAALVAALFAVHPLRAESVAWVSERKDVLCMFFGLAAIWAYAGFAKFGEGSAVTAPSSRSGRKNHATTNSAAHLSSPSKAPAGAGRLARYAAVFVLLALGLMSKPLLVTLPCVLLLLDFWPLDRTGDGAWGEWRRLVVEKLPLFALVAASSAVTLAVQSRAGAVSSLAVRPLGERAVNAVVAYGRYVRMFLAPIGLEFVYPQRAVWPTREVALGATLLLGLSALAIWGLATRRRYLFVGWCWFLGTLVPNIGLVQAGAQAYADRFTYLSGIGLAIMLVWGLAELAERFSVPRSALAALAGAWLVVLAALSYRQIGTWRDSEALLSHALRVDPTNYVAHKIRGSMWAEAGDFAAAMREYEQARQVDGRPVPEVLLLMAAASPPEAARRYLDEALQAQPDSVEARIQLAKVARDRDEAINALQEALRLDPNSARAHGDLGVHMAEAGQTAEALDHLRQATALAPRDAGPAVNMAVVLLRDNQPREAEQALRRVLPFAPRSAAVWRRLGLVLATERRFDEARQALDRAIDCDPRDAEAQFDLGRVREAQVSLGEALLHYARAIELRPDYYEALNNLAWHRATSADAALRDSRQAVELAERARKLRPDDPGMLDTLAAAYAAAERWDDAVQAAEEAVRRAAPLDAELARDLASRLEKYRRHEPHRADSP